MADLAPAERVNSFKSMLEAVAGTMDRYSSVAEKGAGHSLLTVGMFMLGGTVVLKAATLLLPGILNGGTISSVDLGLLLGASIIILLGGAGLKVWDRHLTERDEQRKFQLRIAAAEKVSELLIGNAAEAAPIRPPT